MQTRLSYLVVIILYLLVILFKLTMALTVFSNISNVTSQSSVTINNTTVRGTTSVTFNRQAANSHFLVLVGCSHLGQQQLVS